MVWAGIAAHASVTGYKSNGGMSAGWRVRFNSTGSDGKPRHVSPEAGDRHDSPD
jgi:hypothetical protein